jgi:hypothetical protein
MNINYNDLERIYIAAKDCSMGAVEELTTELRIEQNAKTLVVFKGDKIIYQKTEGKVLIPNRLPLETPRGHEAVLTGAVAKASNSKATTFRWINRKNT